MIYRVGDIERDVREALDENNASASFLDEEDAETLQLNELIRSKIEEGVRMVEKVAPPQMLESGHLFGEEIYVDAEGRGRVVLPDDFMRLIYFRMSDWGVGVTEAISESEALYKRQKSRWRGVRGNAERPVVAMVSRSGGKILEVYSTSEGAQVSEGIYMPYPKVKDGGIDIAEPCYAAVVYAIASLVLIAYGNVDKTKAMQEVMQVMIS